MTSGFRRIASHFASTPRGLLPRAILSLNEQGIITDISTSENIDSIPGVEFYSGILLPATVNAHCHLELSALKGTIPPGGGLTAFAQGMRRADRNPEGNLNAIAAQDALMWAEGVAAVADISNGDASFGVKSRSNIHYLNMLEVFGLNTASTRQIAQLAQKAGAMGLRCGVTPHSTYSLGRDIFARAVAMTPGSPLSVHFMESPEEAEFFRNSGRLREWSDAQGCKVDFTDYGSPAGRIISHVPADRKILLVHNTFITEEDVDRLVSHFGNKVTFVLCPRSNAYITGAQPPVEMLRRKGVRIALGTDSPASNTSLSMAGEMKALAGAPLEELLYWATLCGAEALGISATHGRLETGKSPGVVLLTGIDWRNMSLSPDAAIRRLV